MQIHTYSADTNYSAELTGAEILKKGKVYVAVSKNDERIEDVGGRQGHS